MVPELNHAYVDARNSVHLVTAFDGETVEYQLRPFGERPGSCTYEEWGERIVGEYIPPWEARADPEPEGGGE